MKKTTAQLGSAVWATFERMAKYLGCQAADVAFLYLILVAAMLLIVMQQAL